MKSFSTAFSPCLPVTKKLKTICHLCASITRFALGALCASAQGRSLAAAAACVPVHSVPLAVSETG